MKHNSILYIPCTTLDVCGMLKQGDTIFHRKQIDTGSWKWVRYKLSYTPVYMRHSGNWTLRVHTGDLKQETGRDIFQEYLYVNEAVLAKYLFHANLVHTSQKEADEAAFIHGITFSK